MNQKKHFSRKLRQLRNLVDSAQEPANAALSRARKLVNSLQSVVSGNTLKRILAGTAFAFLLFTAKESKAQHFNAPVKNPFGIDSLNVQFWIHDFADMDNDGDMDMFAMGYYGEIMYYQNTGTASVPQFAHPAGSMFGIAPLAGYGAFSFGDLDGDGDIDLLTTSSAGYYGSLFHFQPNTGTVSAPAFGTIVDNPFDLDTVSNAVILLPAMANFDGDGDMDIVTGQYGASSDFNFFSNTPSASVPAFGIPSANPFGLTSPAYISNPSLSDVDGDGDLDLFSGNYNSQVLYYRNSGSSTTPAFDAPITNPWGIAFSDTAIRFVKFVDIDNDGDKDLFASAQADSAGYSSVWFFEDTTHHFGTNVTRINAGDDFRMFPNPANQALYLTLNAETDLKNASLEVMNIAGQLIEKPLVTDKNLKILTANFEPGVYFVRVRNNEMVTTKKFIVNH